MKRATEESQTPREGEVTWCHANSCRAPKAFNGVKGESTKVAPRQTIIHIVAVRRCWSSGEHIIVSWLFSWFLESKNTPPRNVRFIFFFIFFYKFQRLVVLQAKAAFMLPTCALEIGILIFFNFFLMWCWDRLI